jgi:hypothetical protein
LWFATPNQNVLSGDIRFEVMVQYSTLVRRPLLAHPKRIVSSVLSINPHVLDWTPHTIALVLVSFSIYILRLHGDLQ